MNEDKQPTGIINHLPLDAMPISIPTWRVQFGESFDLLDIPHTREEIIAILSGKPEPTLEEKSQNAFQEAMKSV